MWPVLGALATTYLIRRSRQSGQVGRRVFSMGDGSQKSATMSSIANVGRAVFETMRAVQKR